MANRPPTLRQRKLATELRRLRERTGMTGDQAAEALGWWASKISRIEKAVVSVSAADLTKLMELYDVPVEQQTSLIELRSQARRRGWWEEYGNTLPSDYVSYIELESSTSSIKAYNSEVVHGLLQTHDYAREIISVGLMTQLPPAEIDRRVRVRQARQDVLTRDNPVDLSVVINESVLRRMIGGPDTMAGQISYLVEMAQQPNITIQVLPEEAGAHPATTGAYSILGFPEDFVQDVVYIEGMTSNLYVEDELGVYRHTIAFNKLAAMSLTPDESLTMLADTTTNTTKR
jgi:transcriptional regulator with XRE-family HTH domain